MFWRQVESGFIIRTSLAVRQVADLCNGSLDLSSSTATERFSINFSFRLLAVDLIIIQSELVSRELSHLLIGILTVIKLMDHA